MDLALGVAAAAVSRAGASSLAELAALRLPALLVPYPTAADNHQFFNADAYARSGAARILEQKGATPEQVAGMLAELMEKDSVRARMVAALDRWHAPNAAADIAAQILRQVQAGADTVAARPGPAVVAGPPARPKNSPVV
jgi:UDP-N-acetylglucosamine--N-acetylmuramyl-(pentapeptide) pyrophosphoryl-undecaprenol N-acetylglucosamine transferase